MLTPAHAQGGDAIHHASRTRDLAARATRDRRYGAGGEVAWVGWPGDWAALDRLLVEHGLSGVALIGPAPADPMLGVRPDDAFLSRVRQTIDPRGTFRG